ncbi:DUF3108 domain-containing protein [Thiobacillus denitrificans]|uniref:DUF3108 domain-containing protein n=1 Tax=Thiobacillus denitrificans TaxID=36861 RepID=UPI001EDBB573|nr:DUF3108 domain-containing protein [Thiobacillus denitrificans]
MTLAKVGRSVRPWWLALAGSLLLHVSLLGGLGWQLPQAQAPHESPPIEARLMPPPKPAPPPPVAAAKPKPKSRVAFPLPRPAPPPEPPADVAMAEVDEIVAVAVAPEAAPQTESRQAEVEPAEAEPVAEVVWPPLNPLPPRLDMRFQVRYGLARGEQTLVWINEGESYTLTSVAGATGLTGMFYRGRFVQTSRGRITPRGLVPEEFWDQRGDKRSSARFDSVNDTLTLTPAKGAPRHFAYQGDVQDALSLFFQFALTAPPPAGQLAYTVFNGKKLRDYVYEVRDEETLETALGALRTLHLARAADGDGRFEIWLAIDRHYLPVRVLRSDDKGNEMELVLLSISP